MCILIRPRKWRHRFAQHRLDGLRDEPRSGAPRKIGDDRIEAVISRTLESLPADGTHWSSRGMAKASGLSVGTVQRIWRAFGLQPHRVETFKLSADPDFFAALTERQLRRGVHRSLASLHDAITAFIDQHNADPKPFRWTKSADDILASIERFCHRVTPVEDDQRTSDSGH